MSRIQQNCGLSKCDCCSDFHIVYFRCGFKETITERLPVDMGYSMMIKKARMMPVGYMAQAVHPDDVKTLILGNKNA